MKEIEDKIMKRSLFIYALVICLGAIIGLATSLGVGAYSVIGIINPEFTISSYQYDEHQSNDAFWDRNKNRNRDWNEDIDPDRPPEDVLSKQREESYTRVLSSEVRNNVQGVVIQSIVLFICTVLLFIHWRLIKNLKAESNRAVPK